MATQQPQHSAGPVHVPLYLPASQRGETPTTDARIVNGYAEKLATGNVVAVKRPGYAIVNGQGPIGGGSPNGVYEAFYSGLLYWIVDTTVYSGGSPMTGAVVSGQYSFSETTTALFLQTNSNCYYAPGFNSPITSIPALTGLSPSLVTGCAYLDGTMYVMDLNGNIRGSGINDLTTWNVLNTITANIRPGKGVALFKQLNYVIALKQASMEVFYDAGNPTGSPLASVPNLFQPYGSFSGYSLQVIEDRAFWVTGSSSQYQVVKLQNMQLTTVSTPAIDRLLQNTIPAEVGIVGAWSVRIYGHVFYGFTMQNTNLCLVYDDTTGEWFQWTTGAGNFFPFRRVVANGWAQGSDGVSYRMTGHEYDDNGTPFTFEVVTPPWTGGTHVSKTCSRLEVLADQAASGTLLIRNSDDDYQTWSNFRPVNLNRESPAIFNEGSFRKRAWHLSYTSNTPLRLSALELDIHPGTV